MNSLTSKRKPLSHLLLSLSSTSSRRALCIALFSTSSSLSLSSPSRRSYSSSSFPRRHDEESRNVRVSVWWDIENCGVPTGSNVFKIAQSITAAVRANGIKGPVQISAFGDVLCLSRANQEALSTTGVNLIHIPNGSRNSADRSLLVDLMHWVTQNPPPAHVFLISSDKDFAGILHRLRMNNYNILLAGKEGKNTPGVLCSAATIMWHWDELAKGENLSGRHFNQPPDGPFNSWYGHFKGVLEDPYELPLLPKNSKVNDSIKKAEESSDSQANQQEVLKQIRNIVNQYPSGLSITELRSQLDSKVTMDRNLYGFKKFTNLLSSMRRFVKVIDCGEGQFLIRPVSSKIREKLDESDDTSVRSIAENIKQAVQVTPKADVKTQPITRMVEEKVEPILRVSHHDVAKESLIKEKVEETPDKVLDGPSRQAEVASAKKDDGKDTVDVEGFKSPLAPTGEQNPKSEMGVFKRFWTKWFSGSIGSGRKDVEVPDKFHSSSVSPEKAISEGQTTSRSPNEDATHGPMDSSSNTASRGDAKSDKTAESEVSRGFLERITSWWRNESHVDTPTEQLSEEPTMADDSGKHADAPQLKKHELFYKDTFWSSFESFLRTYRGSDIVLNSTSREEFAKRLKTDGPLVLSSLEESDLLNLIEMLISDKKWIKEYPTQTPRFRVFIPPGKRSTSSQSLPNSNGISSPEKSQPAPSSIMQKKKSETSRSEILSDCQKLLDELLQQNPEGFNIGCFKRKFLEKYGYSLDYQKLGYPKLVSLLQIMPGVKVDCSLVLPDNVVYAPGIASLGSKNDSSGGSDSEMSDLSQKDEDVESQWEELGPVENSNIVKPEEKPISVEYEPSMTDDELSDTEEEDSSSSSPSQPRGERSRKRVNEEDSSLLQILNSWHASNGETDQEGSVDCSKERPRKTYTFVSNSLDSSKDKLIDGILGSLKKSGESRVDR